MIPTSFTAIRWDCGRDFIRGGEWVDRIFRLEWVSESARSLDLAGAGADGASIGAIAGCSMAAVGTHFTVVRSMTATRTSTADIVARGHMLAAIAEPGDLPAAEAVDLLGAEIEAERQPEVTRERGRVLSVELAGAEMRADFRREDNPALADRTAEAAATWVVAVAATAAAEAGDSQAG